jgi:hypothetical protein
MHNASIMHPLCMCGDGEDEKVVVGKGKKQQHKKRQKNQ